MTHPTDPVFETREALEAWRTRRMDDLLRVGPETFNGLGIAAQMHRVTLAHAHLLENDDADRR